MARMPRRPIEELMDDVTDERDTFASHEEVTVPETTPVVAEAVQPTATVGKRRMRNTGIAKVGYKGILWGPGEVCCVPTECTDDEVKALQTNGLVPV